MSVPSGSSTRVTCKRPHPNRQFHELLLSLQREAVQRKSSVLPALSEAISSLEKYPLPLSSGAECAILKGFDQRLCRYIDSQLNGQPTQNKKSKAGDNGPDSYNIEKKFNFIKNTDSNMTFNAKNGQKGNKQLEPNTEKCSLEPELGEASSKSDQDATTVDLTDSNTGNNSSNNNNKKEVQNKNTETKYFEDEYSGPNPVKSNGENAICDDMKDNQDIALTLNYVNYSPCWGWESWPTEGQSSTQRCNNNLGKIYKPDELDPTNKDSNKKNLITEISSDDESIEQPITNHHKCMHNNYDGHCNHCDIVTPVATAAVTFEDYFKEKMKRDAEEMEKCVLPRKMYKPEYRSGAYAILVALLEQRNECPYRVCLTKDELIQKAQKHTNQSFTVPNLDSNYTAWTNTKRLINKGMIQITKYDNNGEDFYKLTAMGRIVAMELVKENTPKVTVNDVIYHGQRNDRVPSLEDIVLPPPPPVASLDEEQSSVFIEMPPGTFDIFMLIDKRENFDMNIQSSPNKYCVYERRSLTVGDFIWIARSRKTGQELVLPYIVERKRMDDLASSIKDGRFHEQKFRLRKCGLSNVIYLLEDYKNKAQYALPMSTLMQAMINTSVLEKFNIVKTESWKNTFIFLGKVSEMLVHEYLPEYLRGCNRDTQGKELMTFEFFNKFSCKNKPLTVRDTFIKMLLQLRGLSIEKALAITDKYSTPKLLIKAYQKCTEKEGELLLSNLKYNDFSRNVGSGVSKTVYKLFSSLEL